MSLNYTRSEPNSNMDVFTFLVVKFSNGTT